MMGDDEPWLPDELAAPGTDRPAFEITEEMVSAATAALLDSGFLRIGERASLARVLAHEVLLAAAVARRNPGVDPNPPCPDCGSFEHFECSGRWIEEAASITKEQWQGLEPTGKLS